MPAAAGPGRDRSTVIISMAAAVAAAPKQVLLRWRHEGQLWRGEHAAKEGRVRPCPQDHHSASGITPPACCCWHLYLRCNRKWAHHTWVHLDMRVCTCSNVTHVLDIRSEIQKLRSRVHLSHLSSSTQITNCQDQTSQE